MTRGGETLIAPFFGIGSEELDGVIEGNTLLTSWSCFCSISYFRQEPAGGRGLIFVCHTLGPTGYPDSFPSFVLLVFLISASMVHYGHGIPKGTILVLWQNRLDVVRKTNFACCNARSWQCDLGHSVMLVQHRTRMGVLMAYQCTFLHCIYRSEGGSLSSLKIKK